MIITAFFNHHIDTLYFNSIFVHNMLLLVNKVKFSIHKKTTVVASLYFENVLTTFRYLVKKGHLHNLQSVTKSKEHPGNNLTMKTVFRLKQVTLLKFDYVTTNSTNTWLS